MEKGKMEKEEVDWKKAFGAAAIGDIADFLLGIFPPAGDFVDITYTLPQMRKSLPDADKDMAYLTALTEVIPFIELLPNWGLLAGGSFIREQVSGKEGGVPSPSEIFGLPLPERGTGLKLGTARTGEERGRGKSLTEEERRARHETIFGALGLPTPEELLTPFKKKE